MVHYQILETDNQGIELILRKKYGSAQIAQRVIRASAKQAERWNVKRNVIEVTKTNKVIT